eukprot:scaffold30807_cov48-Phaeocystis_antarctica.AAC.1
MPFASSGTRRNFSGGALPADDIGAPQRTAAAGSAASAQIQPSSSSSSSAAASAASSAASSASAAPARPAVLWGKGVNPRALASGRVIGVRASLTRWACTSRSQH